MAVFQPYFCNSLIVSCTPGINGMLSRTCCNIVSGASFKVLTRLRRLCSKSNSPRMARAVIDDTNSPVPASLAISSIHSIWIAVESISITNNPACCKRAWKCNGAKSSCKKWADSKYCLFQLPRNSNTILFDWIQQSKSMKFWPHFCWNAVNFSISNVLPNKMK